ncbi:MAG TPA: anhydro-N-acetylmuramic acid kinase [Acetobacteraceae bacterium]|jgi:anhydro-N-acetylmuramic acid kinase|nr:anhydro-N-acetylmuramic acid kinase [Acetobacteraceae bacterium]
MRTIGLMSGTSLDGVDAAWLETDGETVTAFGPTLTLAYDDRLRADLRRILDLAPALDPADRRVKTAAARLTEYHVRAVMALDRPADLIGFHGQTILHQPDQRRTWQIGNAQELAWRTGVRVAWDFRSADVAAGGQGAPLAPVYHAALAHGLEKPLAVLNLGGVGNVTWIGSGPEELVAFDTGPANGPLDDWVARHTGARFDRDGALALSGRADPSVLGVLLRHPYFGKPPPKSLDRQDFAAALAASGLDRLAPADGAATLVAFTAQAVARAPLPAMPRRWLVTGGGRHNPAIMAALRGALGVAVEPVEAVGWDGDALEAQCFGLLAARVAAGLPLSFPGTTGVPRPMPGGSIVAP